MCVCDLERAGVCVCVCDLERAGVCVCIDLWLVVDKSSNQVF